HGTVSDDSGKRSASVDRPRRAPRDMAQSRTHTHGGQFARAAGETAILDCAKTGPLAGYGRPRPEHCIAGGIFTANAIQAVSAGASALLHGYRVIGVRHLGPAGQNGGPRPV